MADGEVEARMRQLAWLAGLFVGTGEQGGENRGPLVERFQKSVDGVAQGEPWCMGFVQYCVAAIDSLQKTMGKKLSPTVLIKTESTVGAYAGHPQALRGKDPAIGAVIVWQKLDAGGKAVWQGHTGIVVDVSQEGIVTVEGNTSPDASDPNKEREGQGVWLRKRTGAQIPGFIRLGYLIPWA